MGVPMKLVLMSDTHGYHNSISRVPDGDILLHSGDFTTYGAMDEVRKFDDWLGTLPHQHKVVIAGNHDGWLEKADATGKKAVFSNAIYLEDSEVTIEGIRIYGAPWTPLFFDWHFMLERGADIQRKWDLIPSGIDILVTHGPPHGRLDYSKYSKQHVGCEELLKVVERVQPKLHVFGHIHGTYGLAQGEHTLFANASTCNEGYKPVQEPLVVEWPVKPLWG